MSTDYLHLNGMTDGPAQYTEMLTENLSEFFNWGLLEAGRYDDINIYSLGSTGTGPEYLYPVKAQGMTDGQVWEAPYGNWVYESGLESARQPISVSGVYVNGSFVPVGTGLYINYPEGRAVFATPQPLTSIVQATYSHKQISFYDQDEPWFQDLIFDSFQHEKPTNTVNPSSGIINLLKEKGIKLPCVVIEDGTRMRQIPKQIGDVSQWVYPDFLFHIVAENSFDRSNVTHIIVRQKDKVFYIFNTNERAKNNAFALDYRGMLVNASPLYPTLVQPAPTGYRFNECRIFDTVGMESISRPPLYRAIVRVTLEIDLV